MANEIVMGVNHNHKEKKIGTSGEPQQSPPQSPQSPSSPDAESHANLNCKITESIP